MRERWFSRWNALFFQAFCSCLLLHPANSRADTAVEHERGRNIYNFRCYFCHGYSGDSRTLAATYLQPKPAAFTKMSRKDVSVDAIVHVLRYGRPNTAMMPFLGILSDSEMQQVAGFVVREFVDHRAPNTTYHTIENGWPEHGRHKIAFPFVTGEIPVSRSWELLSPEQALGRRLYLSSCITCHDRGISDEDVRGRNEPIFEKAIGSTGQHKQP